MENFILHKMGIAIQGHEEQKTQLRLSLRILFALVTFARIFRFNAVCYKYAGYFNQVCYSAIVPNARQNNNFVFTIFMKIPEPELLLSNLILKHKQKPIYNARI